MFLGHTFFCGGGSLYDGTSFEGCVVFALWARRSRCDETERFPCVSPHATLRRTHKNSDETERFRDVSRASVISSKCLRSHLQATLNTTLYTHINYTHTSTGGASVFCGRGEAVVMKRNVSGTFPGRFPCVCHFFEMPKVALTSHPQHDSTRTHTSTGGASVLCGRGEAVVMKRDVST